MDDSDQRLKAIYLAKQRQDVGALTDALRDDEHRPMAAKFLADLGAVEAAPGLLRMLEARDVRARRAAARALGRLGAVEAIPRLREVAQSDTDAVTRAWAVAALGSIGGDAALETVASYLDDPEWVVKRGAAFALGVLGDRRALPLLKKAKRGEPWSRRRVYREAIRAIKRGESPGIGPHENPLLERMAHAIVAAEQRDE